MAKKTPPTLKDRVVERAADLWDRRAVPALRRALRVGRETEVHAGSVEAQGRHKDPDFDELGQGVEIAWADMFNDIPRNDDGTPREFAVRVRRGAPGPVAQTVKARSIWATDSIDLEQPIDPDELSKRQGTSGTPWEGQLPGLEANERVKPYLWRGLSTNIGEFEKFVRSNSVAQRALRNISDRVLQADIYFAPHPRASVFAEAFPGVFDLDAHKAHAERLNLEFFHNADVDATDVLREQIHHKGTGFSIHEYGVDPTREGRVVTFIDHRHQSSVQGWLRNPKTGKTVAFTQQSDGFGSDAPCVDLRKCIHSVDYKIGDDPEGMAELRSSWFYHHGKIVFLNTGMTNRQRFGPGVPVFRLAKDAPSSKETIDSIRKAAKQFYYSKKAFFSLPPNVLLEVMQIQPDSAMVPVLEYFDKMIRESAGQLHEGLGHGGTGSYALMNDRSQEFLMRLRVPARNVAEAFGQTFVRTVIDAIFGPQLLYPVLRFDGILRRSDAEVRDNWAAYATIKSGGQFETERLNQLADRLDIPPEPEEEAAESEPGPDDDPDAAVDPDVDAEEGEEGDDEGAQVEPNVRPHLMSANVRILDRNGDEWMAFRELHTWERRADGRAHQAFRALSEALDERRDNGGTELERIAKRHRDAFTELARPFLEQTPPDVVGLAALAQDFTDDYREAILDELMRMGEFAAEDMMDEIASQVGDSWVPDPQASDLSIGVPEQMQAEALAVAQQVNDWTNDQLRTAARTVANGGGISGLSQWIPNAVFLIGLLTEPLSRTMNEVRETTAALVGPTIESVNYSAVMDGDTCGSVGDGQETCADLDGQRVTFGSQRYERLKPPNVGCLSALNRTRGNRCRCLLVFTFASESTNARFRPIRASERGRVATMILSGNTEGLLAA